MSRRASALRMAVLLALVVSSLVLPSVASADDGVTIMAGNFLGEYYNNISLSGSPQFTRSDAAINFAWGDGSPDPSIPADNFSVRWIGSVYFANAGTYTFKVTTDDGVRLWVDGVLRIDHWVDQSPINYQADVYLGAGSHTIKLEYYEHLGQSTIALAWGLAGSANTFNAEYFDNSDLTGPVYTRVDPAINFDWGWGPPAPGINPDYFSVRWNGAINFPAAGNYDFHLETDDGARVWVDGVLIFDKWFMQARHHYVVTRAMTAGVHQIRMEYFEYTQVAVAKLYWNPSAGPVTEVVVDELSPGFESGGVWHNAAIGYNGHMYWTRNAYSVQENWARWRPALAGPGNYRVQVFIPHNYGTTRFARYSTLHNGVWNTVTVNQYIYYDVWVTLGTWFFNGGGNEYVFLNDVTYETSLTRQVAFDAVRFTYIGP